MAITIHTLNKPWIWVEAVAGGSLPANTDFYFIGFNAFTIVNGAYYGYAPGKASDQFHCQTTDVNKTIKLEIYELGGYVTAYADAGGGKVTVTSANHGLSNGDTVYLRGTVNYAGKHLNISGVTANTFDITATWVADDGASNWYKTPGMPDKPTNYPGAVAFGFKWDYYSMLRGDGSKFQWLNTNDPAYANEWYVANATARTYGHRRWAGAFYYFNCDEASFTTAADGSKYRYYDAVSQGSGGPSNWTSSNLYEGTSSSAVNGYMAHPEIALKKWGDAAMTLPAYQLPSGLSETESAALIFMNNADSNNSWQYLLSSILAANVLGKSVSMIGDGAIVGGSNDIYVWNGFTLRGLIVGQSVDFTSQPIWYNKTINLIHGNIRFYDVSSKYFRFNGCQIFSTEITPQHWYQPRYSAVNSRNDIMAYGLVIDDIHHTSNFTPAGYNVLPTAYTSKDGINLFGRGQVATNASQVLRNPANNSYVRNCNFYYFSVQSTPTGAGPKTYEYTNVTFYQIQSDLANSPSAYNADFFVNITEGFNPGDVVNHVFNCYNVKTPERSNQLIRVRFTTGSVPLFGINSIVLFNMFFQLDIKIVKEATKLAISGAEVTIQNSNGTPDIYSAVTDGNGNIVQQNVKCYTVGFDINNPDGYWLGSLANGKFFSKTTLMNNITVTVKLAGYETKVTPLANVLSAQNITIALKRSRIHIDQEAM